jgi:hypothetical protein
MNGTFLYFESERTARMVNKPIKDGKVQIDDKLFFPDRANPIMLETRLGVKPLYILKWDSVTPAKELRAMDPTFVLSKEMDPSTFRRVVDMKVMGNMLKIQKPALNPLLAVILGLAFGGFLVYYLIAYKVVKLG